MKFSYNWLRDLVDQLDAPPHELSQLITIKTAESEGVEQHGNDSVIEIDNKSLTHRPDLWGHYGMAREVAAILGRKLVDPVKPAQFPGAAPVRVSIEDHTLCPRYSALVFENVTVKPSPEWLQQRLEAVGLNPINNIVDVTNYVLAEIAQPMHAFDAAKLLGDEIIVRSARAGETHVVNPFDVVTHDLGRDRRLLGDRQITGAGANDPDGPRTPGPRFLLDGHAAGQGMVDGRFEFSAQGPGMDVGMRVMSTWDSEARMRAAILTTCSGVLLPPKMTSGKPRRSARCVSTCAKARSATGAAWNARSTRSRLTPPARNFSSS